MKCIVVLASFLVFVTAADDVNTASSSTLESSEHVSAVGFDPFLNKRQEKRYVPYSGVGSYGGYSSSAVDPTLGYQNGYYNPYGQRAFSGLGAGYNGYNSAYGYGNYLNPYQNYYYNSRTGYHYPRPGYGYNTYPSSYFSSNYANSIVGGGVGGLGPGGFASSTPFNGALGIGYQYGPSVSHSIY